MPRARPRWEAGKVAVTIAAPLASTAAEPTACSARVASSSGSEPASADSPAATVKTAKPITYSDLRP